MRSTSCRVPRIHQDVEDRIHHVRILAFDHGFLKDCEQASVAKNERKFDGTRSGRMQNGIFQVGTCVRLLELWHKEIEGFMLVVNRKCVYTPDNMFLAIYAAGFCLDLY